MFHNYAFVTASGNTVWSGYYGLGHGFRKLYLHSSLFNSEGPRSYRTHHRSLGWGNRSISVGSAFGHGLHQSMWLLSV